jgi:hypothetical protein
MGGKNEKKEGWAELTRNFEHKLMDRLDISYILSEFVC